MRCYYSNRDCVQCSKKRNCPIINAVLDLKATVDKLEETLEQLEMKLEPPENKKVVSR